MLGSEPPGLARSGPGGHIQGGHLTVVLSLWPRLEVLFWRHLFVVRSADFHVFLSLELPLCVLRIETL